MATLMRLELIGKKAEIVASKNKSYVGIKGIIIDETKNLLNIDGKKVLKALVTIKIDDNQILDGNEIVGRSYERIKPKK
ncbi:ribonuclease P protein subunit [Candidatus Woesearchaeota archaeon]|nr:ribonuclease P protein subunit [Candidatus Woesearchaeota archaeon]